MSLNAAVISLVFRGTAHTKPTSCSVLSLSSQVQYRIFSTSSIMSEWVQCQIHVQEHRLDVPNGHSFALTLALAITITIGLGPYSLLQTTAPDWSSFNNSCPITCPKLVGRDTLRANPSFPKPRTIDVHLDKSDVYINASSSDCVLKKGHGRTHQKRKRLIASNGCLALVTNHDQSCAFQFTRVLSGLIRPVSRPRENRI